MGDRPNNVAPVVVDPYGPPTKTYNVKIFFAIDHVPKTVRGLANLSTLLPLFLWLTLSLPKLLKGVAMLCGSLPMQIPFDRTVVVIPEVLVPLGF